MSAAREDEIELVRTLAEMLAQELATVDDEDLDTITDRIDALRHARQSIESRGLQCPEAVEHILEIYQRQVGSIAGQIGPFKTRRTAMKLFAVRGIGDNEAVGLFWAPDLETAWWMIDEITDPGDCEFCLVDAPAAVVWHGDVPKMGVERSDEEDEADDREAFAREASFEYAFDDVLYRTINEGWTKVPYTAGEFPDILKEFGSWKREL